MFKLYSTASFTYFWVSTLWKYTQCEDTPINKDVQSKHGRQLKCSNKELWLLSVKEHPTMQSYAAFHITKEAMIYQHGTLSIIQ